jgi:hypothetical protein
MLGLSPYQVIGVSLTPPVLERRNLASAFVMEDDELGWVMMGNSHSHLYRHMPHDVR